MSADDAIAVILDRLDLDDDEVTNGNGGRLLSSVIVTDVSKVTPEHVSWLWPARIPYGKVTVLDGDPGLGKSTLTVDLAARVTTGSPLPDGSRPDPAYVVMLSAEDGTADTIRPRLDAAGADCSKVRVFDAVVPDEGPPRPPALPGDIARLEALVVHLGASLVIVDPLMAYLHEAVNAHRDQDVRRALHPLKTLAENTGAAVVLVRHLNKGSGAALYRGGGSIGIVGAARAGLLVAKDPDDDTRRILAVTKSNLGPEPAALAYRLVGDEEHGCARVVWEGSTGHTVDQLLAVAGYTADGEDRGRLKDAEEFLSEFLAEGSVPSKTVEAEARRQDISKATLRRARKSVGVRARKLSMDKGWVWELESFPEDAHASAEDVEDAQPQTVNTFGEW